MKLKAIAKPFIPNILINWYRKKRAHEGSGQFRFNFEATSDIKRDIQEKYEHDSELLDFSSIIRELSFISGTITSPYMIDIFHLSAEKK